MSKKDERAFEPKGHLISLFPSIKDVIDKNQMTLSHIQRLTWGSAIQNDKWATRSCPISLSPSQQQSLKARPEFFHAWFVGCKLIIASLRWCKENEFRNLPSTSSSPTAQMHQSRGCLSLSQAQDQFGAVRLAWQATRGQNWAKVLSKKRNVLVYNGWGFLKTLTSSHLRIIDLHVS